LELALTRVHGRPIAPIRAPNSGEGADMTTRMTITGLAAAAVLAGAVAAQAADLSRPVYKSQPAYQMPYSWNGFYVGINGGYGFGTATPSAATGLPSFNVDGGVVGGTLGYNYQFGSWVLGIEGDFDWAFIKGSTTCAVVNCELKSDWVGTARARIGYAWDSFLLYGTGGLAFSDLKFSSILGTDKKTQMGWTAGAGVEYALWSNWSVKGEYLYMDFGKLGCDTACGAGNNVAYTTHMIRLGANYRF
jgi:outer membrane immunogenic protein